MVVVVVVVVVSLAYYVARNGGPFSICVAAQDLAANSNVQDAFVIAVEKQARERLERLSALKKIKPVDMTKLSQQVRTRSDFRLICQPTTPS